MHASLQLPPVLQGRQHSAVSLPKTELHTSDSTVFAPVGVSAHTHLSMTGHGHGGAAASAGAACGSTHLDVV